MSYCLLHTHPHTHTILLAAKKCFALVSALPLHHCDKGQSPNTMTAGSWQPDSLPNQLPLQFIGWFNIVKDSKPQHHLSHCCRLSHNNKRSNSEKTLWSQIRPPWPSPCWTLRLLHEFTAFMAQSITHVAHGSSTVQHTALTLRSTDVENSVFVIKNRVLKQEVCNISCYKLVMYPKLISGLSMWLFSRANRIIYGDASSQCTIPWQQVISLCSYPRSIKRKKKYFCMVVSIFSLVH